MRREICRPDQLALKLLAVKGAPEPVLLWFISTNNEMGERWCPDCAQAEPLAEEVFARAPAAAQLIVVEVSRDEWKGPKGQEHFLRKEPYNVAGIPTLARWDTAKEAILGSPLGEAECQQMELLNAFIEKLVK